LKYLGLGGCKWISKEVMEKLNPKISVSKPSAKIEYPDYSDDRWSNSHLPLPIPIYTGTLLDETDIISAFSNCIREIGGIILIRHGLQIILFSSGEWVIIYRVIFSVIIYIIK